jgi:hypothetical protein
MFHLFRKIKLLKQIYINGLDINKDSVSKIVRKNLLMQEYTRLARESQSIGITSTNYFHEKEVIISLTTYSKRIYDVYLAIETLMHQTMKPNKIILWLAEDEFTLDNIPQTLKNLQKRGLTIEFCKDLKSYKKLVPALKKYPEDIIITVDDDALYQHDLVENLVNAYKDNPNLRNCK